MKRQFLRLFGLLAATALLFLTGCDKLSLPGSPSLSDAPFSAVMEIDTEEGDFIANVKRLGTGIWEMEITEPKQLAGLTIGVTGESVSTSINGLSSTLPIETVSDHALFLQVFRSIDNALSQEEPDIEEKDGIITVRGNISTSPYEIIIGSETKLPQEIKLTDSQIQAYISDFKPIA